MCLRRTAVWAGGIYSSARGASAAAALVSAPTGGGRRAWAAGRTWTSRTTSAEWAARAWHTTVVDSAGAIYVIGGDQGGTILFQDVCVSTDGGALTGLRQRGDTRGGTTGVCRGV